MIFDDSGLAHVTGTTVTAVADSSIQLRCIHTCVLVLIQPRSRRSIFLLPFLFCGLVPRNMSEANIKRNGRSNMLRTHALGLDVAGDPGVGHRDRPWRSVPPRNVCRSHQILPGSCQILTRNEKNHVWGRVFSHFWGTLRGTQKSRKITKKHEKT